MTDDLLPVFLAEARELVEQAGDALLLLDRAAGDGAAPDRTALDQLFRAVHTLKGSTALFDLLPMGTLLHAAEDALDRLRTHPDASTRFPFDVLLRCLHACETWLDAIERTGALPADAATDAAALQQLLPGRAEMPTTPVGPAAHSGDKAPDWLEPLLQRFAPAVAQARRDGHAVQAVRYRPAADCFFLGDDPMALLAQVPALAGLHLQPDLPVGSDMTDPFTCILVATLLSTAPLEALRAAFRSVPDQVEIVAVAAEALPDRDAGRLVRVDAGRIDTVVDLAGEMLVARNSLGALVARATVLDAGFGRALSAAHGEIDRLARALRRTATGLRLAPLEPLFRRLPRLLREIAAVDGKMIDLELSGGDVELDRAVADRLFEPLLHVLRNAVGHGIEDAPTRLLAGKPERGLIRVSAVPDGEQVVVLVQDDGAGIDPERIRAVARDKALMEASRLSALDAAGCLELLFLPGFSTAATVTALSGRGVGMDAVRDAVDAVGGRVSLGSRPGVGTEVRITLPREVSITTMLLVGVGGERFAVPIDAIREIVRIAPDRVVAVGSGEAFELRGRVLPFLPLAPLLGLHARADDRLPATVLVAVADGHPTGLAVDEVFGRAELLVRRLDGFLRGTRGVAGTTLGADGRVLMVLDLSDLLSLAAA